MASKDDERFGVHPIPSADRAFREVVEEVARWAQTPAELGERLRALYPDVRISERALSDEPRVYYVYRDGSYVPDPGDAWWTAPGAAYVDISATTGRIVKASGSWADLMGTEPRQLINRPFTDFVLPEALGAAQALFASILAVSEVRSKLLMRRPDGHSISVEFRAVRSGDVCRVHYRPHDSHRSRKTE
jgi:PAS domain-containing protein